MAPQARIAALRPAEAANAPASAAQEGKLSASPGFVPSGKMPLMGPKRPSVIATPARSPMRPQQLLAGSIAGAAFHSEAASKCWLAPNSSFSSSSSSSAAFVSSLALAAKEEVTPVLAFSFSSFGGPLPPTLPAHPTPPQPSARRVARPKTWRRGLLAVPAALADDVFVVEPPSGERTAGKAKATGTDIAIATPGSPTLPGSPAPAEPPKRRRLTRKQPAPCPNPWASSAPPTPTPATSGAFAAAKRASAAAAVGSKSVAGGGGSSGGGGRGKRAAIKLEGAKSLGGARSERLSKRRRKTGEVDDDDSAGPDTEARADVGAKPCRRRLGGGGGGLAEAETEAAAAAAIGVKKEVAVVGVKEQAGTIGRSWSLCLTTTGIELGTRQRRVLQKRLGFKVVDDWQLGVTYLVADTFRRTTKLMCAICTGTRIVVPAFLDACLLEGRLVDDTPFLLRDMLCEAAFAKKQGFFEYSLTEAVARSRVQGPLLDGLSVHVDAAVPGKKELQLLVEAAGGQWLRRPPPNAEVSASSGPQPSVLLIGRTFDAELLREAACTQILRFERYRC